MALPSCARAPPPHHQNILIADDGGAKLCDFGLARRLARDNDPQAKMTTGVGTPVYVPASAAHAAARARVRLTATTAARRPRRRRGGVADGYALRGVAWCDVVERRSGAARPAAGGASLSPRHVTCAPLAAASSALRSCFSLRCFASALLRVVSALRFILRYMPPETIRGNNVGAGAAGDVFSLGVTLWSMWRGRHPWPREPPFAVMTRVERGERPPMPRSMPPALAALVAACWTAEPARRPKVAAVVARLHALRDEIVAGDGSCACGENTVPGNGRGGADGSAASDGESGS